MIYDVKTSDDWKIVRSNDSARSVRIMCHGKTVAQVYGDNQCEAAETAFALITAARSHKAQLAKTGVASASG